jgi:hypothetical protein
LEEKKVSAPRRKWRNMNSSAVSAFNYGWDILARQHGLHNVGD